MHNTQQQRTQMYAIMCEICVSVGECGPGSGPRKNAALQTKTYSSLWACVFAQRKRRDVTRRCRPLSRHWSRLVVVDVVVLSASSSVAAERTAGLPRRRRLFAGAHSQT